MTWKVTEWGMTFAVTTKLAGADAALMIGAVTAPVTILLGMVVKWYTESRTSEQ